MPKTKIRSRLSGNESEDLNWIIYGLFVEDDKMPDIQAKQCERNATRFMNWAAAQIANWMTTISIKRDWISTTLCPLSLWSLLLAPFTIHHSPQPSPPQSVWVTLPAQSLDFRRDATNWNLNVMCSVFGNAMSTTFESRRTYSHLTTSGGCRVG